MTDITRTETTTSAVPERCASTFRGAAGGARMQTEAAPAPCCGGPAPAGTDGCCARDAEVKSAGGAECGCGSAPALAAPAVKTTGCCG